MITKMSFYRLWIHIFVVSLSCRVMQDEVPEELIACPKGLAKAQAFET
jgi:hypothetical protein